MRTSTITTALLIASQAVLFSSAMASDELTANPFESSASATEAQVVGPLAEQIIASRKQYARYVAEAKAKGEKPNADHQTRFLVRVNDELIAAQKNEVLKQKFFKQLGEKAMANDAEIEAEAAQQ